MNHKIKNYIEPTPAELKARKKRNLAIAAALFGFVAFVLLLTLSRLGGVG